MAQISGSQYRVSQRAKDGLEMRAWWPPLPFSLCLLVPLRSPVGIVPWITAQYLPSLFFQTTIYHFLLSNELYVGVPVIQEIYIFESW